MNGFWTIQQSLAFFITIVGAIGVGWKIVNKILAQISENHSKLDAIEALLDDVKEKGMTSGAEKALQRLERRLLLTQAQVRVVMEIDGTGYVETDNVGNLIYCNSQFTQWTGLTLEEARGYGWIASIHPEDRSRIVKEWENAVKDKRPVDLWYRYKYKRTETSVHARSVVVYSDDESEILGFIALIVPVENEGVE